MLLADSVFLCRAFLLSAGFVVLQLSTMQPAGARNVSDEALRLEAFGHYKKAAHVRRALEGSFVRSTDPEAVQNLILEGADDYEGGEHCAAIAIWRRVMRPVRKPLFDGDALAERGNYAAAFGRYRMLFSGETIPTNAIFLDTGSIAHLRVGLQAGAVGNFAGAESAINKAISVFPPFPWGLVMYGDVLDSLHRRREALSAWVTALRAEEPVPGGCSPALGTSYLALEMLLSRVNC